MICKKCGRYHKNAHHGLHEKRCVTDPEWARYRAMCKGAVIKKVKKE